MTHPRRRPFQSEAEHKAEMADWMGTTVGDMDRWHDAIHVALCFWLGITSQAMRMASGVPLSRQERELADIEEDAALAVQRLIVKAGVEVATIKASP